MLFRSKAGDVMVALASSGVHSNGFSLVRRVFDIENKPDFHSDELGGSLWETLLAPTRIYVKPVLALMDQIEVKSVCHITGGGFYENIPRALPNGLTAKIEKDKVQTPAIFRLIQKEGNIPEKDMFNTFNMGVGMCCIVSPDQADRAVELLNSQGERAYILGEVVPGDEGVLLW